MHSYFANAFPAKEKADLDAKIAAFKPKPMDVVANGGFDVEPEAFLPAASRAPLSDAEVVAARQMLSALGYGNAGDASSDKAIKDFQTAYGLEATGKADRQLVAALKSIPR